MTISTDGGHDALTNSRFQLLSNPEFFPARCNICGKGGVPVVSWGLRVERVGAIMFCVDCMTEAGKAIGMIPQDVYEDSMDALESALERVSEERNGLKRRIEDENVGDGLDSRIRDALVSALRDDSVLDLLSKRDSPVERPAEVKRAADDDDGPIFRL